MPVRRWTFRLSCTTRPGEIACVSGDIAALGQWSVAGLVPMAKEESPDCNEDDAERDERGTWSCTVELPAGIEVQFRYCICLFVDPSDGQVSEVPWTGRRSACHDSPCQNGQLSPFPRAWGGEITTPRSTELEQPNRRVVRQWETQLKPRKIGANDKPDPFTIHDFGHVRSSSEKLIHPGWLNTDSLVELKLYERAVHIWKKRHKGKHLYVKVTPVDVSVAKNNQTSGGCSFEELDESMDISATRARSKIWPSVYVASLNDDDCHFRPQSQFGIAYDEDAFISFQAHVFHLQTVAFLVDIYARPKLDSSFASDDDGAAEHVGSCYVLPSHFRNTEGRMETPILSRCFQPVGQFCAAYLIVTPLKGVECSLEVTYARHWKAHWKGLDVGHRGLGASYTEAQYCPNILENTIASLKDAVAHGADMVEFDVQISKDLVPVIYHNFELVTCIAKKRGEQKMMVQMPLKNLTLEQLHNLKIHHVEELSNGPKTFDANSDDEDDHEPFPTLEQALKRVDPHAGFNIELKWDVELKDGSRECHNPFEINLYADIILKTVLEHAGHRKIFFSTFNPDMCTVLRAKQNKYPVLFLTQADTKKYPMYRDPRCWSVEKAARFAEMSGLLGVNIIAEVLLKDPKQVDLVKSRGQVVFCWTDGCNDKDTLRYLKEIGVDGVVYDRMDVNNSKEVKESIFLVEKRLEEEQQRLAEEERLQEEHLPILVDQDLPDQGEVDTSGQLEAGAAFLGPLPPSVEV